MRIPFLTALMIFLAIVGTSFAESPEARIRIELDPADPSQSRGMFLRAAPHPPLEFAVGYGREGILAEGERFRGGYSLLGTFRVNAILSGDRFVMDPDLVARSGKSEAYLKEHLFANMSAIDFDGDGEGREYGGAYLSLEPLSDTAQPFSFNVYAGKFRWYSYALHGTQDESRIGQSITGGCINIGKDALQILEAEVQLGDLVEVRLLPAD